MTNNSTFLFPTRVSRSIAVLKSRGEQTQISVVFNAEFGGKAHHKMLRDVRWVKTNLLKASEIGAENVTVLGADESPLYRLDWSDVPTSGDFKKDYPKRVV